MVNSYYQLVLCNVSYRPRELRGQVWYRGWEVTQMLLLGFSEDIAVVYKSVYY